MGRIIEFRSQNTDLDWIKGWQLSTHFYCHDDDDDQNQANFLRRKISVRVHSNEQVVFTRGNYSSDY